MEVKLKMDSNVNKEDHDYALGHVHSKDKKGFLSMFVVMLGFTFFSASMLTGGNLGIQDFRCIYLLGIHLEKRVHILHHL